MGNKFVSYSLIIDRDRFELKSHITIGRHLDNDLVVAGEDVFDFHARIELKDRGPWLVRLNNAPLHVNKTSVETGVGLLPDDEVILGQHNLTLKVTNSGPTITNWRLISRGGTSSIALSASVLIGRSADCDLCISEGFVSRRHARIYIREGLVWIRDLDSSNGTFINAKRIEGAVLLMHGDEVAFDTSAFQLVGEAEHLTPVVEYTGQFADSMSGGLEQAESSARDPEYLVSSSLSTVEISPLPLAEVNVAPTSSLPRGSGSELDSSTLIGLSDPIMNEVFPLMLGRYLLGRDLESDIRVIEDSVSGKHAELDIRIEGAYLTNLIATNGTLINGQQVQTQRLQNGDTIDLGRVRLVFREKSSKSDRARTGLKMPLVVGGLTLSLAGVLFFLIF